MPPKSRQPWKRACAGNRRRAKTVCFWRNNREGADSRYAEQFYILEGEFTVWAGRQTAVLRPGDVFTVPAGTAHAVAVTGGRPGRALAVASPSGFARLIMGAGTPDTGGAPPAGPPDMALYDRIQAEIGDETLGPPGARPE
jgi:mannose-6-phosphate isomerase-like protein (cupin superfamily)